MSVIIDTADPNPQMECFMCDKRLKPNESQIIFGMQESYTDKTYQHFLFVCSSCREKYYSGDPDFYSKN